MARTDSKWNDRGGYIDIALNGGSNVLINGLNRYLNFNTLSGSVGYGIRDNGGVMEYKDASGAWTAFSAGGGGGTTEVFEFADLAAFPPTGVPATIYIADDTKRIYHWDGAAYAELSPSTGGGGLSLTEIEVDMGDKSSSKRFTIVDAAVTPANKILIFTSPNEATGRRGNDWEVDQAFFTALAGTGNFLLSIVSPFRMRGYRKLYYQVV